MSANEYVPDMSDLETLWIIHHLKNSPDMKHDPDSSEAGDGFWEFRQGIVRDRDHAVALERKAVVRFLRGWDTCGEHCASFRAVRTLAEAIEKGEHNG